MLKKKILLFICLAFLRIPAFANEIDSLNFLLKTAPEIRKAEIYNTLAYNYAINYSFDTANIYVHKALNLAIKYKNIEEQGNAYYNYGVIYYYKSNLQLAAYYKKKAAGYFEKSGNIKAQAVCLNDAGNYSSDLGKPKEALDLLYKSYEINLQNNLIKGQVENLINMGIVYYNALDYQNAMFLYNKALPLAQKIGKPRLFFSIYNNISSVYSGWGKHDSAIVYCQKALEIAEQLNNNEKIATACNNIGYEYMVWKKYDQALEFYNKALQLDLEINYELSLTSDYSNIGLIYFFKGDNEKAMQNFRKSYDIAIKLNTPYYIALSLGNMGKVYHKQKQLEKSIEFINQELELIEKHNIAELSLKAYQQLGTVYFDNKDYDKSLQAYFKSSIIAQKANQKDPLMDSYKLISDVYKIKEQPDSALHYYELYTAIKDSIFNKEQNLQLAEFQVKYNLIKKDQVIDQINAEKAEIAQRGKKLVVILILIVAITATAIVILVKKHKRNKKFIEFLSIQKQELEQRLAKLEKESEKQESIAAWNLPDDALLEIYDEVVFFLKESKIYLSDELTIQTLSQKSKIQAHHISKAVNNITSSNFNDFINSFRISEAKDRIKDPKFQLFTMEAIGKSVGFKSRTSFIAAFKKFENTTPSEYKKMVDEQAVEQLLN